MAYVEVRPGKCFRYRASFRRYIPSPLDSASYSSCQLSPRKPLCTSRTTVLPPPRPSTRYSNACSDPSGFSSPWNANRSDGCQAVTVDSMVQPGKVIRTAPPAPGSTSFRPMNQELMPGPVVMASQTCSGVASTAISARTSNSCGTSGLLRLHAGVHRDDDPVLPPALGGLVVVLAHQPRHRTGQLLRERRPVRRRGEPHHPVQGERRHRLTRPR